MAFFGLFGGNDEEEDTPSGPPVRAVGGTFTNLQSLGIDTSQRFGQGYYTSGTGAGMLIDEAAYKSFYDAFLSETARREMIAKVFSQEQSILGNSRASKTSILG